MPSMLAFAAPVVLALPLLGQSSAFPLAGEAEPVGPDYENPAEIGAAGPQASAILDPLSAWRGGQIARQVRIEQRVVIRVSPRRTPQRQNMFAELPQTAPTLQVEERKIGKCLAADGIAGVQTDRGNRLLLFLRDQRIISVNLEKACRARDFYSGFYLEQNEDGQLCVDRDKLQSRSGVKCEIERMRQLVAVSE